MTTREEFLLNGDPSEVAVECVSLTHSSGLNRHLVRNHDNWTATLEDGVTSQVFEHYSFDIKGDAVTSTVNQPLQLAIGDFGQIIPAAIDAIRESANPQEYVKLTMRVYSSEYTDAPLEVVTRYVTENNRDRNGSIMNANALHLDKNRTGSIQTLERFPFLKQYA
jgi:hypothetical protein